MYIGTQRFISRFLVKTWISGPDENNPGKALLNRMVPLGLINYLKYAPINEEHRCALDEIEEEFYCATLGLNANQGTRDGHAKKSDVQYRMRSRINTVLKVCQACLVYD
jgi:hypothetical protein